MKINEYSDKSFLNATIERINGDDKIVITQSQKTSIKEIKRLYYGHGLTAKEVSNRLNVKMSTVQRVVSELMNRNQIKEIWK